MDYLLLENVAVFLSALCGFLYGAHRFLRPKQPLYATMIVLGIGCAALGRLYQCVRLLTGYSLTDHFQIGVLGTLGTFSFFLSANYGQIDSLVDDGSPAFRKYRRIALCGPALIAVLYAAAAAGDIPLSVKFGFGAVSVAIAAACYFHVKHIFIPDVAYGVVRAQRHYNMLALDLGIVSVLEMNALAHSLEWLLIVSGFLLCVFLAAVVPVMDKGVRAWRI